MTPPPLLRQAALAAVVLVVLATAVAAQTTNTWSTGFVTNQWTNATNWSPASVPNALDSRAIFASTNTNPANNTIQAVWTNTTITVGSIFNTPVTNSTAVVGDVSITNDFLTLATSSGKPELFVSSASSTIFMYATVQGTNGFTKTGPGQVTFRFNTTDQPYTGDIVLLGGTLGVNQASSLGSGSNALLVGSNATLTLTPGSNAGVVGFEATRSFVVSNGVTFNIQTSSNSISAVFSNPITGAGRVDFIGPSSGTNEASSTKFTLAGSNNWTNRTTIQLGAKVTLGAGSSISTGVLSLSGGSGSYAGLDLGGNTQSTTTLEPSSSLNTPRVMVISNGTLNVGSGASFTLNGTNGTIIDLSGLTAFSFAGAAGNRTITIQPNTTNSTGFSANNTNEVRLAATGAGSNNISAASITVGGAVGGSAGTNHQARLILGSANTISTTTFSIGGFNAEGVVEFGAGITNGTTSLRGSNGVARMGNLTVGSTSSGVRSGAGTFDVGTVDASISNTFIGVLGANANNVVSNRLTMAGGTFDTLTLRLGAITNTTISSNGQTSTAIFQQNGGTVIAQSIIMGDTQTTLNTNGVAPTYLSSYNLSASNAVLRAQTIGLGASTNFSTNTVRKINFGAGTIRNYDPSTDLTISGLNSTVSGRLEIAVASNSSARTFSADANRTITIESTAVLTSTGNIVKAGTGTLVLNGANTYSGGTDIREGTLAVFNTSGSATGTGALAVSNGATLTGTGIIGGAATIAGALKPGSSPGDLTFNDSLTLESSAVLTLEITGTGAAGQFDRLLGAGTNTFTLGGTLSLDNTGFTPVFGQTILVFSNWGSFSGSFATITGADLGGGLSWDTGNLAVDGTMQVVPEPTTWSLLALAGGGALLWRLRRRGRR